MAHSPFQMLTLNEYQVHKTCRDTFHTLIDLPTTSLPTFSSRLPPVLQLLKYTRAKQVKWPTAESGWLLANIKGSLTDCVVWCKYTRLCYVDPFMYRK